MKKKKLLTILTALVLVAVVGAGSTLAYMSQERTLTNVFTIGDVDIELSETDYGNGEILKEGILDKRIKLNDTNKTGGNSDTDYKLYPSKTVKKDPIVKVLASSEQCYVFMKVTGAEAIKQKFVFTVEDPASVTLPENSIFSNDWIKIDPTDVSLDGIYMYNGDISDAGKINQINDQGIKEDKELPALFNYVTCRPTVTEALSNANVIISACAIQADGVVQDTAIGEAKTILNK